MGRLCLGHAAKEMRRTTFPLKDHAVPVPREVVFALR